MEDISNLIKISKIDHKNVRYPHCIVWTPIPLLTWFLPFIGHLGIAYTDGVIRDFSASYMVSKDRMAFGVPTRYIQLNLNKITTADKDLFNKCIDDASTVYMNCVHRLICDNCHSFVALALNCMKYDNKTSWNMIGLCAKMFFCGRYVGIKGILKQWIPFILICILIVSFCLYVVYK